MMVHSTRTGLRPASELDIVDSLRQHPKRVQHLDRIPDRFYNMESVSSEDWHRQVRKSDACLPESYSLIFALTLLKSELNVFLPATAKSG
jgi:hypothetical protein